MVALLPALPVQGHQASVYLQLACLVFGAEERKSLQIAHRGLCHALSSVFRVRCWGTSRALKGEDCGFVTGDCI